MTANNTQTAQQDALAAIRARKAEVGGRIRESSAAIKATTRELFAPPKAGNKMERFMNLVEQGIAMYDGVMLGMRVMRNVRRIFRRK